MPGVVADKQILHEHDIVAPIEVSRERSADEELSRKEEVHEEVDGISRGFVHEVCGHRGVAQQEYYRVQHHCCRHLGAPLLMVEHPGQYTSWTLGLYY